MPDLNIGKLQPKASALQPKTSGFNPKTNDSQPRAGKSNQKTSNSQSKASKPDAKISNIEAFLILSIVVFADLLELIVICFGLPDFWIPDIISFPITQIYLRIKGVPNGTALVTSLAEFVPYIDSLPLRTIGMVITIINDRSPQVQKALEKMPKAAKVAARAAAKAGTK